MTNQTLCRLNTLLFGHVRFDEHEEYQAFQFKFLCIVILAGAVLTGLLIFGSHAAVHRINPVHVRSMTIFTALSCLIWWALRGHKQRYVGLVWLGAIPGCLRLIRRMPWPPCWRASFFWRLSSTPMPTARFRITRDCRIPTSKIGDRPRFPRFKRKPWSARFYLGLDAICHSQPAPPQ